MDDDSLQDSGTHETDCETPADEPPNQKEDGKPKKDFKITLKQIFEFGGGIAGILVVWAEMDGEHQAGKLIFYGLALLLFYLLPCHVIYELLKKKRAWMPLLIWLFFAIVTAAFIVKNSYQLDKTPALAVVVMPQPDYIEGTKYTQKRLNEIFPFGFAVFFFGQNRITSNQIFKNGMMDWKLDVDQVSIEPDFYSGNVTWTIPNVDTTPEGNGTRITINGGNFIIAAPLKEGCIRRGGFMLGNKPVLHVMTLGDNQRTPVFAIGYRIPAEGEGRPPSPPYFFIQP